MRMLLKLPLLAAVICDLQSSVHSRALPDTSIVQTQNSCHGTNCPAVEWNAFVPRSGVEPIKPPKEDPSPGTGEPVGSPNDPSSNPEDPDDPVHIGSGDPDSPTKDPNDPPVHIGTDPAPVPHDPATPPTVDEALSTYLKSQYAPGQLIGASKPYDSLTTKGQKVDNLLKDAITKDEKDVDIPPLKENYEIRDSQKGNQRLSADRDKDLEDPLKLLNVDMSTAKYSTSRIFSNAKPAKVGDEGVVAAGKFFDQDGVIIGEDRFSANDLNPADKKTKPSDITFQQWEGFASHKNAITGKLMRGYTDDVSELRAFIGRNILSRSTVETTFAAHFKTGQPMDKPGVFRRDSQGAEKDAFDAFLGTDFISSYNYMLKDHHQALKNKQIKEIHTFPKQYTTSDRSGRQKLDIVVILEAL